MDIKKVIIRPMAKGEEREVAKIGRKAFQFIEALFVNPPKKAIVAEYENRIIGAIIYKFPNKRAQHLVYIDEAFVDPAYQGMGVGKKLYTESFCYLQELGCDIMTALVKDDNVASWKPFIENGFRRVTFTESIKHLGLPTMLKHYFNTPMFIAVGMDLYIADAGKPLPFKKETPLQLLVFILANMLLLLPLWLRQFAANGTKVFSGIAAHLTILVIFALTRFIGGKCSGEKHLFRFNNCGGFLSMALAFWGNLLPMNANWYPVTYENTDSFRRKLATPELIKWCIFVLLSLLSFIPNPYFSTLAALSQVLLVFMIIPLYPFEVYGAGRIYRYKKGLWLLTAIITIALLVLL